MISGVSYIEQGSWDNLLNPVFTTYQMQKKGVVFVLIKKNDQPHSYLAFNKGNGRMLNINEIINEG